MKNMFITAAAAVLLASCGSNYQKTQSGLLYKIASKGNGPQVKKGEFLKVNYSQKIGDSLVVSSFDNGLAAYAKADSVGPIYNVLEILPVLHQGDSVVIVELGDSLEKRGMLPPFMKHTQKRTWTLKVVKIIPDMEAMQKDQQAEMKAYQVKQESVFENYMSSKKSTCQKTGGGVYVEIKEPGNGPQADSGKFVSVRYKGKFMPSEKVFETNMDDPNKQPLQFPLGVGGIIDGWEEGLKLFHAGGKGTLYVPYQLAYKDQAGPGGLPFQNLIFDIEMLEVKDAPPAPKLPQMPPVVDSTTKRK
jgi:FKBP-type peptidyl-prolyl cis-trans isomerase